MKKTLHNSKGISLVEVLIGVSIIASAFVAIIGIYTTLSTYSMRALPRVQAAMLAEEGIEAVRQLRDEGFTSKIASLNVDTAYHLAWSTASSSFIATTNTVPIDSTFYRTLVLSDVYRDGSFNIASSGTLDPTARKVTVNVSWRDRTSTSTYTLESYVFNTFNN